MTVKGVNKMKQEWRCVQANYRKKNVKINGKIQVVSTGCSATWQCPNCELACRTESGTIPPLGCGWCGYQLRDAPRTKGEAEAFQQEEVARQSRIDEAKAEAKRKEKDGAYYRHTISAS